MRVRIHLTETDIETLMDYTERLRQHRKRIGVADYFTPTNGSIYSKELLGRVGEYAVAHYLGVPYPFVLNSYEVPGGGDVAGYEVRTRSAHYGDLCTYPTDSDRIFILATTADYRTVLLHGWAYGAETKHQSRWRTDIPFPAFVTSQSLLHPLETLPEPVV